MRIVFSAGAQRQETCRRTEKSHTDHGDTGNMREGHNYAEDICAHQNERRSKRENHDMEQSESEGDNDTESMREDHNGRPHAREDHNDRQSMRGRLDDQQSVREGLRDRECDENDSSAQNARGRFKHRHSRRENLDDESHGNNSDAEQTHGDRYESQSTHGNVNRQGYESNKHRSSAAQAEHSGGEEYEYHNPGSPASDVYDGYHSDNGPQPAPYQEPHTDEEVSIDSHAPSVHDRNNGSSEHATHKDSRAVENPISRHEKGVNDRKHDAEHANQTDSRSVHDSRSVPGHASSVRDSRDYGSDDSDQVCCLGTSTGRTSTDRDRPMHSDAIGSNACREGIDKSSSNHALTSHSTVAAPHKNGTHASQRTAPAIQAYVARDQQTPAKQTHKGHNDARNEDFPGYSSEVNSERSMALSPKPQRDEHRYRERDRNAHDEAHLSAHQTSKKHRRRKKRKSKPSAEIQHDAHMVSDDRPGADSDSDDDNQPLLGPKNLAKINLAAAMQSTVCMFVCICVCNILLFKKYLCVCV
jgi:hypothetical protein